MVDIYFELSGPLHGAIVALRVQNLPQFEQRSLDSLPVAGSMLEIVHSMTAPSTLILGDLDQPAGISLGMGASPQCPLPFRPAKSL